jgi:hypothetical protein
LTDFVFYYDDYDDINCSKKVGNVFYRNKIIFFELFKGALKRFMLGSEIVILGIDPWTSDLLTDSFIFTHLYNR